MRVRGWIAKSFCVVGLGALGSAGCDLPLDGAHGADAVSRSGDEGPGVNCANGGTRIEFGSDENLNRLLDDAGVVGPHGRLASARRQQREDLLVERAV